MVDITNFPRGVSGRDLRKNIAPFAAWMDIRRISEHQFWAFAPGKLFLGAANQKPIGIADNRHIVTVAGSRAGKGVSSVIPNLIEYPGSMLVIDPKGENAKVTAARRGQGSKHVKQTLNQTVHVLDPFGTSGYPTARFNPLEMIDTQQDVAIDNAALIADALVIQDSGEGRHWTSAARNFLRGLILFVCTDPKTERRNLLTVREFLTGTKERYQALLAAMIQSSDCKGVIRRAASSLANKDERERSGVISTAVEQTDFLDSPALAACLGHSDFKLADLKCKPMTIYLCLPALRMSTHNRWLRIIVNLAIAAMEDEKTKPPHPVVFLMDEFAVLDHLASIEKAAGLMAGFDVKLWPIIQDLSQIKAIYEDSWETFLGNAGVLQFFGNNDLTTLEYISRRLGKTTIMQVSKGEISTEQSAGGFTGESTQFHSNELMTAEEIGRYFSRQSRAQILLYAGADPIAIDRIAYADENGPHPYFKDKFDPRD